MLLLISRSIYSSFLLFQLSPQEGHKKESGEQGRPGCEACGRWMGPLGLSSLLGAWGTRENPKCPGKVSTGWAGCCCLPLGGRGDKVGGQKTGNELQFNLVAVFGL